MSADQPILLVEDNELNRDMLIRRLNRVAWKSSLPVMANRRWI